MQTTTKSCGKHAGFAVIRSYQPARIERELLAQVFDLAGHGATRQSDGIDGVQQRHDLATDATAQRDVAIPVATELGDAGDHELERAA